MSDLPVPLTPPDCELRDFAFMPLDVVRLRDSDLAIQVTGEEFRCAVLLWCAAWHQIPAASLPDDDKTLASLAGFGRAVGEWEKHKAGALRGWIKCSDGRLYHPVVAEKANESWAAKHAHAHRKLLERLRKKGVPKEGIPSFDQWFSAGMPKDWGAVSAGDPNYSGGKDESSGGRNADSAGSGAGIPAENALKGQGQGQGQGQGEYKNQTNGGDTSDQGGTGSGESPPPDSAEEALQSRTIEIAGLLRKRGAALQGSDPRVREWAKRGYSDAKLLSALETAQERRASAKSTQPINAGYLESILADPEPDAATGGKPQPKGPPWWSSDALVIAKGREYGIEPRPGESMSDFKGRVQAAIDKRGKEAA
ncbi:DUF1376 domain-containing protein [Pigmentiphaga sp. YJ18]|uniref:DUF1376 domain-containing protein n=1 Tax=Pigmentiphaga sp. YJ18 TaxID=3134907 RepID=UPI003117CA3D